MRWHHYSSGDVQLDVALDPRGDDRFDGRHQLGLRDDENSVVKRVEAERWW